MSSRRLNHYITVGPCVQVSSQRRSPPGGTGGGVGRIYSVEGCFFGASSGLGIG